MSEADSIRLAVIVGSVRKGRFGLTVADWFVEFAGARPDLDVEEIDLAEYDLDHSLVETPAQVTLCSRLGAADAFVIVTPEYNHSFPGHLKTAIDSTDREFAGKPVAFVAYGGLSGGLRAVEALRVVMAEVHAVTVREVVSFHGGRSQFNESGEPIDPDRIEPAANRMLDQLTWWTVAARAHGQDSPYPN